MGSPGDERAWRRGKCGVRRAHPKGRHVSSASRLPLRGSSGRASGKDLSEEEQKAEVKRYIELRDRQEKAEAERGAKKEAAAKAKREAEEKAEADAELARRAEKKAVYIPAAEDKNEDEQDKEAFKECGEVTDY